MTFVPSTLYPLAISIEAGIVQTFQNWDFWQFPEASSTDLSLARMS